MSAADLKSVLTDAALNRLIVLGFVIHGYEDADAAVAAAADRPIVLQAGPLCRDFTPVSIIGPMMRELADRACVPVVVLIDHATTLLEATEAIDSGFTAVMFDDSTLPIAENIAKTAKVVRQAHAANVSVEGEIGVAGYAAGAPSAATSPDEAERFEQHTGIDALAISIGNTHLQRSNQAQIAFDVLGEIENATSVPLVLHGGSGIAERDRQWLSLNSRVCKINIGTEIRRHFGRLLRDVLDNDHALFDRIEIMKRVSAGMTKEFERIIRGLASAHQSLERNSAEA